MQDDTDAGAQPLSLAQLMTVLDALPSGAVLVDGGGAIAGVNAVALNIFGYAREELVGRPLEALVPEDRRALHATLRAQREVTSSPRPMGARRYFDGVRRDGTLTPVKIGLSAVRTREGAFTLVALTDARDAQARDLARDESEARFRQLADAIREVFWLTDVEKHQLVYVSPAYEAIWGRPCDELYANARVWMDAVHPDDRARVLEAATTRQALGTYAEEYRITRPDGATRWIRDVAFPVRDATGRVIRVAGVAEDITERRHVEAQLLQAQKMESVGLLAGGVAHDFNNWLTVIHGNCELLLGAIAAGETRELVDEVRVAADRAATLTRQLLAFSRQQIVEPRDIDLGALVLDTERMLRRLLGEDIVLRTETHRATRPVWADPGLLVQVLMNLAVNARDAMPRGGYLSLEAQDVALDEAAVRALPGLAPGAYVRLTVRDTGSGMQPEVRARVFEPFFTTKGVGRGTGLGLSVVHGIITQSGGVVEIESEVGVGTAVKVYLPATKRSAPPPAASASAAALSGAETVLVVEDEETVRRVVVRSLAGQGYTVLQAASGDEALARLAAHPTPVALIVTDVVMPFMDGRELAERAATLSPHTRVLFTSGYTQDAVVRRGVLHAEVAFLQKPYTPRALLRKVRAVLDGH